MKQAPTPTRLPSERSVASRPGLISTGVNLSVGAPRRRESPRRTLGLLLLLLYPMFWLVSNYLRANIRDPLAPYLVIQGYVLVALLGERTAWGQRSGHLLGSGAVLIVTAHTLLLMALNPYDLVYQLALVTMISIASLTFRITFCTRPLMLAYLGFVVLGTLLVRVVTSGTTSNLNYVVMLVVPLSSLAYAAVSGQLRNDERLRDTDARFRRLSAATREGVAILRRDQIVDGNQVLGDLLLCPLERLIYRSFFDFVEVEAHARVRAAFASGAGASIEVQAFRADGTRFTAEVARHEVPFEGTSVAVLTMRDVTEWKLVQDRLQRARDDAEAANRAKDRFVAQMSHELRTPLGGILGFTQLLARGVGGPLSKMQAEYVELIEESGKQLLSSIDAVLEFARADQKSQHLEPVKLADLVTSVLLLVRPQAKKKDVALEVCVADDVQRVILDIAKVKHVLLNLLSNGVKFTPEGGKVTVQARCSHAEEGDRLEFTIQDSGIGIENEDMSRLFQPFEQLDSSLNRRYEGIGLGLALVKRLVASMNGRVAMQSVPGKGSSFIVDLPLVLPPDLESALKPRAAARSGPKDASASG